MRASGSEAELGSLGVGHHHNRGGAVVERAAVARGDQAVGAEHGLEVGHGLVGDPGARAVVGRDHRAVGRRHRGDLPRPEPVVDGLLGEVLAAYAELVELAAGDAARLGEVLGGLAHRHVDVGHAAVLAWVVPGGSALRGLHGARLGVAEHRVVRVGPAVRGAGGEPRHGLDAGRDEHVALAGLDRVEGHPRRLHRRGAVAGDRRGRHVVHVVEDVDDPGHVEAALAAGQAAAEVDVVDRVPVESGHLVEGGAHDGGGEVVGTQVLQGALAGAADGGTGSGDDDGLRHASHPTVPTPSVGVASRPISRSSAEVTKARRPRAGRTRAASSTPSAEATRASARCFRVVETALGRDRRDQPDQAAARPGPYRRCRTVTGRSRIATSCPLPDGEVGDTLARDPMCRHHID